MVNLTDSIITRAISAHDGISMACDAGGRGTQLLLFVHGWTCRRSYWAPQMAHFRSSFRVAAPDLPGHGDTGAGERNDWRVAALGRDVATGASQLGGGPVILIGHSMGGAVCLEAARLMPETVAAAVLVDTFIIDYGGLDEQTIHQIAAPFEADFKGAVADLVKQTSTEATPEILKQQLIQEMSAADPAWALPLWRDLLAWDPRPAFEALKIPVHAINGALIPESARSRCAPFVTETIIPGSGHFLQMEDPHRFNQTLDEVLAGLI